MAQNLYASNLFDTIAGLPIHPLAVHFAVVLLPLSALALGILILVPKWRKAYLPLTVAALVASTGLSYLAKESGEALAERIGEPQTHAELGSILFPAAAGLSALAIAFYLLQRTERPKWQIQASAATALVAIISVSTLTYFVGHSGAEATWANRISVPEAIDSGAAPSDQGSTEITMTDVASHSAAKDCWTVVDGVVYDLTSYMKQHPGGEANLARLCGIDGTSAFNTQHGGQSQPMSVLESFAVGYLAADSAAAATTEPSATPTDSQTSKPGTFTATEVAKHNTGSDCWSVVNGKVYDLTSYVSSHPGGSNVIKAICGKDGTAAFTGQHAGASRPNNTLNGFLLGSLATSAAGTTTLQPAPAQSGGEEDEEGEEGEGR